MKNVFSKIIDAEAHKLLFFFFIIALIYVLLYEF